MVITVTCPSCSSAFPVDPAKIPEGGVNARCSSCGDIFRVEKPAPEPALPTLEDLAPDPTPAAPPVEATPAPAPEAPLAPPEPAAAPAPPVVEEPAPMAEAPVPEPAAPAPEPAPAPAPPAPEPPAPEPVPEPAAPEPSPVDPFAEAAPFEQPAAPPEPEPEPAAPAVQGFTFGKRDPTDKAKRLARVLVSDMIMYNAERHQTALAQGTLVQDFEEEIEKSWKEFVEQVGEELANGAGRQFWTDALNDILAKGQKVF
jgi:predicted Zn finger-like uncharacterized protein